MRAEKHFSEMSLFGHWVPSLLHFKSEHLVFLLGCKILEKVIPMQFHTIVTFVRVHVVEYVSSTDSMSFLNESRRKLGEISWQVQPCYVDSNIQQLFFFCHPLSASIEQGSAGRPDPAHKHVSGCVLCSINLGSGTIWKEKMHGCTVVS